MSGRQAKLISNEDLAATLQHIERDEDARRARVIVLLSARAGLRACEIAGLTWAMVTDSRGNLSTVIDIENAIAKRGSGRRIPLHSELRTALTELRQHSLAHGPVVRSRRGGHMRPNSIVNWFVTLYRELGLQACSSHSGRRTFITQAARSSHLAGGCLRDVQLLAGHRSLIVTQGYIEGDTDAQRRIVEMLG